ncbi:hypothetical protein G3M48_006238 [Beauveria asiatica]|uniref:Uncharacterized protein n=1 Tax=Beauveria asiatica TaxID=1069075 RepID=A0AAW0RPJ9_9HYPO
MAPDSVDRIGYVADEVPGFEDLGPMLDVSQTPQDGTVQAMGAMHNMNEWPTPESGGSLICWHGNGFNIGLSGDCTLAEAR